MRVPRVARPQRAEETRRERGLGNERQEQRREGAHKRPYPRAEIGCAGGEDPQLTPEKPSQVGQPAYSAR